MKRRQKSPHIRSEGAPSKASEPAPIAVGGDITDQPSLPLTYGPGPMTSNARDTNPESSDRHDASDGSHVEVNVAEVSADDADLAQVADAADSTPVIDTTERAAAVDTIECVDRSGDGRELFSMPLDALATPPLSVASRLRAARESRGWSADDVAARLRLPQRVIRNLESGENIHSLHDVYLRGYLASYARLVEVTDLDIDAELQQRQVPVSPDLVATGRISHSRYLFDRYSVPAVYVMLTGLIVAPAVWLASHGGMQQNLSRLAPLDNSPTTSASISLPTADPALDAASVTPVATEINSISGDAGRSVATDVAPNDAPLMASLASFPNVSSSSDAIPASAGAAGSSRIHLALRSASWVEILGDDGHRYEFGLLPAGAQRDYDVAQPVSVRLGNALGADLVVNGQTLKIGGFQRANVAHFRLSGGQAAAVSTDN